MPTASTSQRLINAARSYLGTPFRHQGRRPGKGLDCVGLILVAAREAGVDLEDYPGYGRQPQSVVMGEVLAERLEIILPARLRPADVLWLHFGSDPYHLALYTERATLIHALAERGVVEHGFRPPWPGRVRGYYRIPHIADGL